MHNVYTCSPPQLNITHVWEIVQIINAKLQSSNKDKWLHFYLP